MKKQIHSGKIKKTGLSAILQYKLEHNPVVHDYYAEDTYLVKSFTNRGNIHYYGAILAASHTSLSPYINFRNKIVNTTSQGIEETPVNYGLECTYSKGNFFAEVNLVSPFTDRKFRKMFQHALYAYYSDEDFKTNSRYCHIKLAYTLDFGRQTKKVRQEVDRTVNSSLLKSF